MAGKGKDLDTDTLILQIMVSVRYDGDVPAATAVDPAWARGESKDGSQPRLVAALLYGSWNVRLASTIRGEDGADLPGWASWVEGALRSSSPSDNVDCRACTVQADADEESLDVCIGEGGGGLGAPPELPALVFVGRNATSSDERELRVEHVSMSSGTLEALLTRSDDEAVSSLSHSQFISSVSDALSRLFDKEGNLLSAPPKARSIDSTKKRRKLNEPAVRLFIAGDRSQVGKTSMCLGLLGSLLEAGYAPDDLAYIKPATQCEQTQLVEHYCQNKGIAACVPIGPIVYYKGFTRAFLKGETGETSAQMLQKAGDVVDKLAVGKRVVIIDGVGYPAVGSITGTDNASVAKACGRRFFHYDTLVRTPAPVLLIGKSGVGDAVDSFNINATYFAHRHVPVIGAIFNKLSLEGFYSLSNCKEAIEMYFEQYQPQRTAFGFIPEMPSLKNAREHAADASKEDQLKHALKIADLFVREFGKYVNVDRILAAAKEATAKSVSELGPKRPSEQMTPDPPHANRSTKNRRLSNETNGSMPVMNGNLSREQIEAAASMAGAAGA